MKQLGLVLAFVVCSGVAANAQTIADRARAERAKKPESSKAIVITNADIKTTSPSTPADAKPAGEAKPAAPEKTETPAGQHDEKWWREQFASVREAIRKLDTQIPVLESDSNTVNRELLQRSYDPDGRGQKAVSESKTKLENAKSERTKLQMKLTQLEDDLRRSGQPAGWSR